MKIAVLCDTNLNDRKGLFNAILNRTKQLESFSDCKVQMFCFQDRPGGLNKLIRKRGGIDTFDSITIEGLKFNVLWYYRYLIDDTLTNRLHRPPFMFRKWANRIISMFSSYDIITAHGLNSGEVARLIHKKYGMPYFVTWHGTDIHTTPFLSSSLQHYVTTILQEAECNFFVSQALQKKALSLVQGINSEVLYNGVSEAFYRYTDHKREMLRVKLGVTNCKVIAFVGNLIPIKNALLLPDIFYAVKQKYKGNLIFWIIGDGYQRLHIEGSMKKKNVDCVFWGNMSITDMPDMMNSMDVLVLPSKNESFGLVLVEAISCGANAVGSRVGGIPEVIGDDNTFELNNEFVSKISDRVIYYLMNNVKQEVKSCFSWKETALKEFKIYGKNLKMQ